MYNTHTHRQLYSMYDMKKYLLRYILYMHYRPSSCLLSYMFIHMF